MSKVSYITEEGLKKLREELAHLESVERPNISKQIAEARDKGDLSENAEYDAAKEAQGMLEMKIAKLKETIAGSRIIDESKLDIYDLAEGVAHVTETMPPELQQVCRSLLTRNRTETERALKLSRRRFDALVAQIRQHCAEAGLAKSSDRRATRPVAGIGNHGRQIAAATS